MMRYFTAHYSTFIGIYVLCLLPCATAASFIQINPQPYFSERDSPFYRGIIDNTGDGIYLETFEDQQLNTPFVTSPTNLGYFGTTFRQRQPDAALGSVWSVDGDDGVIDGDGFSGDSWITLGSSTFTRAGRMQFDFQPDSLGRYPRYVGIVITGANDVDLDVDVIVRDVNGFTLNDDGEFDPKEWNPPGGASGGDPRTHRFVGFYHEDGISRLQLANVWQVDHLQYGFAIPEPSTHGLCGLMATILLLRRHRPKINIIIS